MYFGRSVSDTYLAATVTAAAVLLEGFFLIFTADSVRDSNQIRLPFGEGKTSPIAVEDVARVLAALLANPQPHIGKIYHLTGPSPRTCISMHRSILRRLATRSPSGYSGLAVAERAARARLAGSPGEPPRHMADLHRARRYDRMSDDVRTLTGQGPLSVPDFVSKNAITFTASAKEA